ncbi:DUF72 domain-containing protein [Frigidibacter sp.]|uniref:DUF72 domain-containing protein n=1 Tax=Frigidibacter sp. TaxID=2586418 RepID=UPI002733DD38|nr:DUF72 domain-containing protein [Frigidibacter sp.]MDP3340877.1 DUF72 domain-containing protein [Frigidibacter sp.]
MTQRKSPSTGKIRIGIGGWVFAPWRSNFYPEGLPQKSELDYASRQLTSLEVNGTFYRTQTPETFQNWHDQTPDDFVFALKAPRYTTSRKVLAEAGESTRRFLTSGLTRLQSKLGPINWQFAPNKRFDPEDLAAFLALLPSTIDGLPLRHALELRHEAFHDKSVAAEAAALAKAHNVAIVIAGDSPYPRIAEPTADFVYARIMGTEDTHLLGYAPKALDAWAAQAKDWANTRDVYLYVISGAKARNPSAARALMDRL